MPTTLSFAHFPSFAGILVRGVIAYVGGGGGHTTQLSRIKQRPPATDLSGGNTSAESLTPRRSNLAVSDTVDFQLDLFSFAAVLLLKRMSSDILSGTAEVSTLYEVMIRHSSRNENNHVPSGFPVDGEG